MGIHYPLCTKRALTVLVYSRLISMLLIILSLIIYQAFSTAYSMHFKERVADDGNGC